MSARWPWFDGFHEVETHPAPRPSERAKLGPMDPNDVVEVDIDERETGER